MDGLLDQTWEQSRVTAPIWSEYLTVSGSKAYFDSVLEIYATFAFKLSFDKGNVNSLLFKEAML